MRYKIGEYSNYHGAHSCTCTNGLTIWIDLTVNRELPIDGMDEKARNDYHESLVGKEVDIERISIYLGIAHGVKLIGGENV